MKLQKTRLKNDQMIHISGSKSISNRLLILKELFGNIEVSNLSDSQDTALLQKALTEISEIIDVHHAGTAMRFLTSFFAISEGKNVILKGSERLQQRPIQPLVEALRNLGAKIEYLEKEGFPPLKISGKKITKNSIEIAANVSSQFITSLMLIGAELENGLEIILQGKITSRSYIEMSRKILEEMGIKTEYNSQVIQIFPKPKSQNIKPIIYDVESDWSSASYFYSFAAIGRKNIRLKTFKQNSLQGDSAIVDIYEKFFGIKTHFHQNEIDLIPIENFQKSEKIELDLNNCPDIAQTICVTAAILKIPFAFTGLETLKVKETDRLQALQNELQKIGCETFITNSSIKTEKFGNPNSKIEIETYQDHRMAMSFAPYCLVGEIDILNENVVEKSYPKFWEDLNEILH